MHLSDKAIKNAKPADKIYRLKDGDGLYLQVDPSGKKKWRFRYFHLGKENMVALGGYPEVSLAEARQKRLDTRKQVIAGADPSAKKKHDKRMAKFNADNSFGAVALEWFETNKGKWTADHAARLWRRIEANILPALGDRPISEIKSLELLDTIRVIEKRGATELSHRLLQTCANIFRFAVLTSRAQYNPTLDLRGALVPHKAVNHPTIKAGEIPKFLRSLDEVDASDQNKLAMRLLMLTFVRTGELRQAKWEDIDFKAKEWRLPAHTTKMKELHIVPLSVQAIACLEKLGELTGWSKLLVPSQQRRKHSVMSENTLNAIIHKMGYKGQLVGHGFRALASTTLNENGFRPDVIERQLAHAERNKIRAAYNRAEYLPERREMMDWWGDYVEDNKAAYTKVLPLKRAGR